MVELTLTQKIATDGANMTKTSVVNLVDLAGRYAICFLENCFDILYVHQVKGLFIILENRFIQEELYE